MEETEATLQAQNAHLQALVYGQSVLFESFRAKDFGDKVKS